MSKQDFVQLLEQSPKLAQQLLAYYPDRENRYTQAGQIDHMSGLLLHAIIRAIPAPIGKTFKTKQLNQIKKKMHKLATATRQVVRNTKHYKLIGSHKPIN